jgi:MraZ protein
MADDSGSKPKFLLGQEEANVDDKGRALFAKKKRERLGEDFVMCLGDNGCCIYAYPADVWNPLALDVISHDPTNQGRQTYSREVLGTAVDDLNFDTQGRAVIPRKLREDAKIKDKIYSLVAVTGLKSGQRKSSRTSSLTPSTTEERGRKWLRKPVGK